ncbi:hypothetical protein [Streptomyces sp. NPDC006739]|uniref:hypothetical protein n=1 Tax=Streptomyces sp. NPDC006739 TaxID=3364763 RepID=UPI003687B4C1
MSVRVRVLLMGDDDRAVAAASADAGWREHGGWTLQVRVSPAPPLTELYVINGRTVLTTYFHVPGEQGGTTLHV